MSQATFKKWGNQAGIRFPAAVMKAAALNVDDTVDIEVQEGRIVLIPTKEKTYSLNALLSGITEENMHNKADFGKPTGKEML
ncbi:TPA: AbrB/MazE/SpoVT family DNA-binding domain-containing protein [Klebsiella aerogenes]|uniref:AbrB/MazE/SpoVT family DNA-binding domain-containing protein n=1 Tax=Klebsiella aerogenes TaxID=548 RepID=UPI0028DF413C|nr:AbrB/MazE/SpoVT family DNA-binding domain-containing protein [Klebsiella aerogenes]MDT8885927.1 AbrB/MazE/SpoVT family DNA-binding domain-containing protein [Klebsiella aerogenes]HBV9944372.1 AbrB/MazE/SpoVT family DNA-binding domain-containing protein [Klebsiella aerogenes]